MAFLYIKIPSSLLECNTNLTVLLDVSFNK